MSDQFALIIEDTVDIANYFALALQAVGYETEIVSSGDVALERLETMVPDVVVLDLHLPMVMGPEILHRIRADARLAKTRVMIVTADALMAEEIQDEADLVLIKPVSLDLLSDLAARLAPEGAAGEETDAS